MTTHSPNYNTKHYSFLIARTCPEGMMKCENRFECVPNLQVCDGSQQCSDASDEDPNICSESNYIFVNKAYHI